MDRLSELGTARGFAEQRVAHAEAELAEAKKELGRRIGEYIDYVKLHPGAAVGQLIEVAKNDPECFKCHESITELDEVRIVTVRVDGEPVNVWVHADHARPGS